MFEGYCYSIEKREICDFVGYNVVEMGVVRTIVKVE